MIAINDLRIGNLITDPDFPNIPSVVVEIQSDGFIVTNYNDALLNVDAIPIPLSKEVVAKIKGVRNLNINYNGGVIPLSNKTYLVVREFMGSWNIYVKSHHEKLGEYLEANLHQLQNLYYCLTGNELEVGNI